MAGAGDLIEPERWTVRVGRLYSMSLDSELNLSFRLQHREHRALGPSIRNYAYHNEIAVKRRTPIRQESKVMMIINIRRKNAAARRRPGTEYRLRFALERKCRVAALYEVGD